MVRAGAVGGYAGAHMVQAGEDVTFIDPRPAHVEHMRNHGLRVMWQQAVDRTIACRR
jgi:2-dehydropantoate 2-reductase